MNYKPLEFRTSNSLLILNNLLLIYFFSIGCNHKLQNYIKNSQKTKPSMYVYLEPVRVGIEIGNLSSISSRNVKSDRESKEIEYSGREHARWFQLQLANYLEENNFRISTLENADLIIKTSIVDMSEIRPKMFIEGLSIGLVFGLIAGELSGDPQVGLGVFLLEVVEEFVILYILKSYFLVTTIETEFISAKGDLLKSTEFTAYSNKEYISKLPKQKQDIRENKVRASLDQNAKDIVEYLKNYTNQNN
ncbi:MAG: hypothetical protein MH321_09985 [Leptospiraceae bacterium]|nr:hypothetical protein [Leptospiraceae bacterium]